VLKHPGAFTSSVGHVRIPSLACRDAGVRGAAPTLQRHWAQIRRKASDKANGIGHDAGLDKENATSAYLLVDPGHGIGDVVLRIASRKIMCSSKATDRSCRCTATATSTPENVRIKMSVRLVNGAFRTSTDHGHRAATQVCPITHSERRPMNFAPGVINMAHR
jgi:hypothetical protein